MNSKFFVTLLTLNISITSNPEQAGTSEKKTILDASGILFKRNNGIARRNTKISVTQGIGIFARALIKRTSSEVDIENRLYKELSKLEDQKIVQTQRSTYPIIYNDNGQPIPNLAIDILDGVQKVESILKHIEDETLKKAATALTEKNLKEIMEAEKEILELVKSIKNKDNFYILTNLPPEVTKHLFEKYQLLSHINPDNIISGVSQINEMLKQQECTYITTEKRSIGIKKEQKDLEIIVHRNLKQIKEELKKRDLL